MNNNTQIIIIITLLNISYHCLYLLYIGLMLNNIILAAKIITSIINKIIVSNKEVSKYTNIPYWVWVSSLIAIIVIIVAFFA